MERVKIVPLTLKQANSYVAEHHRHHKPVVGHRFSLGLLGDTGELIGVAIVGRPMAREIEQYETAEVVRLCTDGTKNACSALYGACRRVCKEMGFRRLITYILESEPGTSLKASGWKMTHTTDGGTWDTPSRRRVDKHPTEPKTRWEAELWNA